jgi:hypothetical protein
VLVNCPNPGTLTNVVTAVSSVGDPATANNRSVVTVGVTSSVPLSFTGAVATDSGLQLTVTGQPGTVYYLDASTNLTQWLRLSTNVLTGPSSTFTVPMNLSDKAYFRILTP